MYRQPVTELQGWDSPEVTSPQSPVPSRSLGRAGEYPLSRHRPTLRAMFKQIGAGEIILILAVLLLLFGAKKLPELARSLGKSARELRKGMHDDDDTPDPDAK